MILLELKTLVNPDIPFKERLDILANFGLESNKQFENDYQELINYFKEYDPLYLCSFCAYYFLSSEEGIDEEAINGFLEFPPFYVEVLQAFSLMNERELSAKPLHEKVEPFKALIQDLNKNQSYGNFKHIKKIEDEEGMNEFILRTDMMINTLAVRNWAYVSQMKTINQELASLISQDLKK